MMRSFIHRRSVFLSSLFALFLCTLLSACVHVEQKLVIAPDGSGEFVVRYGMSQKNIDDMEAMSREAMQAEGITNGEKTSSPFNFSEEEIRNDFKAYEEDGVSLKDVKISNEEGWKYVKLDIAFASLEGLSKTEFVSDRDISLTKSADGNYVFHQAAPAQGTTPADMAGMDEASVKNLMAEMMKGFRASMTVETPGKVIETTADTHDEKSATWNFDLDSDTNALERARKIDLNVKFDGTGLDIKEFKSADGGS